MPLEIVRTDITTMQVDAIVNAANTEMRMGGGVCGAIFRAAGVETMKAECDRIGSCGVGEAVFTSGGRLPAKHVIHTAGPIWHGGSSGEEPQLRSAYANSLALAIQLGCESIAFPLISSGAYGYPKELAFSVAVRVIGEFLASTDLMVYLTVFDDRTDDPSAERYPEIARYIRENYGFDGTPAENETESALAAIQDPSQTSSQAPLQAPLQAPSEFPSQARAKAESSAPVPAAARAKIESCKFEKKVRQVCEDACSVYERSDTRSLEDVLKQLDESFSKKLMRLIDEKGMTDSTAYKQANVDRRVFSTIRRNDGYKPSKSTAIAFAVALRLSLDETRDLLGTAGFSLSRSSKADIIIEYFIVRGEYDINQINMVLFEFHQPLLGV